MVGNKTSVVPFQSVGMVLKRDIVVPLHHGKSYVVAVRGQNHVGLHTTSMSTAVTIDATPPNTGKIAHKSRDQLVFECQMSTVIEAAWTGFDDDESGIQSLSWSVGTKPLVV